MIKMVVILSILLSFYSCQAKGNGVLLLPKGWSLPVDTLFNAKWRDKDRNRFLKMGLDLNCDKLTDSVLILQPNSGNGVGLFVFISDSSQQFNAMCLFDSRKDSSEHLDLTQFQKDQEQRRYRGIYGIQPVGQGLYETACGRGYYDCKENEPMEILVKCDGIDFFLSDAGGNSYYYWDNIKEKFISYQMSD